MKRISALGIVALVSAAFLPLATGSTGANAGGRSAVEPAGRLQPVAPPQPPASDTVVQTFPETGVTVTITKRLNANGKIVQQVHDQSGRAVDLAKVTAAENAAGQARHGRIDAGLDAQLSTTLNANQRVPVAIWVNVPDVAVNRSLSSDQQLNQVERAVTPVRDRVLGAVRQAAGAGKAQAAKYGPVVFADLTPGQIRAIAKRQDVSMVYGQTQYSLANDDGATTEAAHVSWQQGNLGFGTSSRPVVHEPDGVSDYHPNLNNANHPVVFWCSSSSPTCPQGKQINTPAFGTHASQVAGVIASTHPLFRGIAPNAQMILSANTQDFSDANLVRAFEWARGNGGNPTNMSWGSTCPDGNQNFMSRYVDWAVRNLSATFTISSGNTNGCAANDLQVSSPGNAWGAITVGAIDDVNNGFWSGDAMAGFSRWQNPTFQPGMEKPEVVAVGVGRRTTTDSGISGGSNGTSFSAPAVAGQVTQMLARRPGQTSWPETNKAAVLVSAYHDVTGGLANRLRDGVGAVVMNNSDDTYRLGRFFNTSGNSAAGSFPKNFGISLTAGQVVRAAIAWDSRSAGGPGPNTLGADIDLCVVRNDTNTNVACSVSVQNAWELVEFTAPVTGAYTIRANLFSFEAGWPGTFLGAAWSTRALPSQCTNVISVPSAGAAYTNISTANGGTYFDAYAGWAFNQSGRERVFTIALPTTRDLRITDNNAALDVHIVRFSTCSPVSTVMTVLANGANVATVNNAPAGRYFLILDGRDGAVGTAANVAISVFGP
jgi:hypothetical protein